MPGTTRPHRPRGKPLRLLQFTDLHVCGVADGRVRDVATLDTFRDCLADARARHWPVDALLLTGDLVQDDPRGYLLLASALGGQTIPVHCLPGNHDLPAEMAALLERRPFDLAPVLRYGAWTLVQLDTSVPGAGHGELTDESLAFLDEVLTRYADTHVLVIQHHQPVPIGSAWLDSIGLKNGAAQFEVIGRHANVRGVLWGHVHQPYEEMRDGVALISTPSTCFQFVPGRDDYAIDERPPGYRWLQLYPDGEIESRVVWLPGENDS